MLSFNPKHLKSFWDFLNTVKIIYIARDSSLFVEESINSRSNSLSSYKQVRFSLQLVLPHLDSFTKQLK